MAKVIPPRRRGSFFGTRQLFGGLLTFAIVGPLVRWLLGQSGPLPFPFNYGALGVLALISFMVGLGAFAIVKEPPLLFPAHRGAAADIQDASDEELIVKMSEAVLYYRQQHEHATAERQEQAMEASARNKPVTLVAVDESNFGRRVLHAPVPVLALFGAPACSASRALRPLLCELAAAHSGAIRFATINAQHAPLLASQFGLNMTPTLIVVQHAEIATRVVGFITPELLRLLCEQVASGLLPPEPFWSPVEATFEDLVVVPMLDAWGFTYLRQAACPAPARGRIDFLVYERPDEPPLTLFENKRQIVSAQALAQAAAQAHGYARALGLPSCVVAAPAGLWIYASAGTQPALVRRISSLELLERPNDALAILRQMRRS